jgi:hypothetical protein
VFQANLSLPKGRFGCKRLTIAAHPPSLDIRKESAQQEKSNTRPKREGFKLTSRKQKRLSVCCLFPRDCF